MEVLAQDSVRGRLDISITVVPLGHTVYERPLQVQYFLLISDLIRKVPMSLSSTVTQVSSSKRGDLMNLYLA